MMDLFDLRRSYALATLDLADVDANPIVQFRAWFDQALGAGVIEPNAMTLATATPDGVPSARIVLLKTVDDDGFTFFTDYRSAKGRELDANPHAAVVFLWKEIERQVRIKGLVARTSPEESTRYYDARPLGSRYGAWASTQSATVPDRAALEAAMQHVEARYAGSDPPRPEHWGGYRLVPDAVEFWQGRPNRLHDRLRYRRVGSAWQLERLSP
ncbi:MAG: pyridoxamine 5'-phosphate oxidase [Gemmatimonadaceae bacterium]|nr:pyridoxamine 5'-phosphate oxidase [Gemmatimonadaceae bacterium]